MASAYSILHNYRQETYGPNYQLMAAALQYKQNALDTNKMRIQSVYNQLGMLDIAKGQDQEYVEKRLESARDIINKYQGVDLSDRAIADSMLGKLSEVVDEPTKNAVLSTKLYRSEQAEWEKMKVDKPDLYSDLNRSYAMRGANAWLSDGQVGTKYKGGGGFIAFSDVNAKLTKDLPKVLETAGIEFVEIAPGSSYFRDKVTRKRVTRLQVDQAINTILNEQDKRQLQINAWGQYDGMSEDQLSTIYDDYNNNRIEEIETAISSLETLYNKTPEGSELKSARKEQLDQLRNTLSTYKDNGYSSVKKNFGKEAAYNTLYNSQFRNSFMDTYSVDVITGIDTYDNDVKSRDYEMKIKNYELNLRKQEFEEAKEIAKSREKSEVGKENVFGDKDYVDPQRGSKLDLGYLEKESAISRQQELEKGLIGDVKSVFGLDDAQLRDFKKEIFDKGYVGKKYVEFNGKRVQLLDDNGNPTSALALLKDYENNVINITQDEREAFKVMQGASDKMLWELRKVAQGDNPDIDFYHSMPKFNFKFVKDPDSGLMKKVTIDGSNHNNYSYLLKKENLSDEERLTLKVYHRMHLMGDPNLSKESREALFQDMRTNLFRRLDNKDFMSFPRSSHSYKRLLESSAGGTLPLHSGVYAGDGMISSGFFKEFEGVFTVDNGSIRSSVSHDYAPILTKINDAYNQLSNTTSEGKKSELRSKINSYKNTLKRELSLMQIRTDGDQKDFYLSELGAGDLEYYDKAGSEVSLKGIDKIISESVMEYNDVLETRLSIRDKEASEYKQIFSEGSGHKKLLAQVDLPSNSTTPITIWREWDKETKRPSDKVHWSYKAKKDGEIIVVSDLNGGGEALSASTLFREGIIAFGGSRSSYDASEGANPISLGSSVDEEVHFTNVRRYGVGGMAMSNQNLLQLVTVANKIDPAVAVEVRRVANNFESGAYEFKIIPEGGIWQYGIYKDDKLIHKTPTEDQGRVKYSNVDVATMLSDSENIMNNVMYNYLYKIVEKARLELDIQLTDYERQQILR